MSACWWVRVNNVFLCAYIGVGVCWGFLLFSDHQFSELLWTHFGNSFIGTAFAHLLWNGKRWKCKWKEMESSLSLLRERWKAGSTKAVSHSDGTLSPIIRGMFHTSGGGGWLKELWFLDEAERSIASWVVGTGRGSASGERQASHVGVIRGCRDI